MAAAPEGRVLISTSIPDLRLDISACFHTIDLTMSRLFIGTAGWSYEDWEGVVYPEKRGSRVHPLRFLARYIDLVEVNSTFYRPPVIAQVLGWIKAVAEHPEFQFTVKLHQAFTHERKNFSTKDIDVFKSGLEPIMAANRLAALLLQFPWSYQNTEPHREYLAGLFNLFSRYPLALEVRHGTWNDPAFFGFLHNHRVSFCNIDQVRSKRCP